MLWRCLILAELPGLGMSLYLWRCV